MSNSTLDPTLQRRESILLAPYAMHSADSAGRVHPEPVHPYRGPFQRDRDRILHTSAFRRLSGKTQVFTGLDDYHRTRLTHTMEVASIARTIGRALRLNEDLIEALALLHDIGHPPFGHAGEDALNEILAGRDAFTHNRFALTLVEELERPYPHIDGINLSREVLEGQRSRVLKDGSWQLLEVQTVDLADSITYDAHDLDDGVKLGWLGLADLLELPLVRRCHDAVTDRYGNFHGKSLRRALVHELINRQVLDVIGQAELMLEPCSRASTDEVRQRDVRFTPSAQLCAEKKELEQFLYERLYRHADLIAARQEAQAKLKVLVSHFTANTRNLPASFRDRCVSHGDLRAVIDYVAGMTDSFCLSQFGRIQS